VTGQKFLHVTMYNISIALIVINKYFIFIGYNEPARRLDGTKVSKKYSSPEIKIFDILKVVKLDTLMK
jgi:hypothetical protein